ncbi:type II toxin-antitoxin system YafQ family toxin [Lonepinella koalarum]|uniref:mRNA interferase YafQ n=1 Tax=Lonepinella koalarum TaxID=53417 RepID=A0A4R1KZN5_9PAST|nr:mRNA interferase YafQ [Lonepinella koalarum]
MNPIPLIPTTQFKRDAKRLWAELLSAEWTVVAYHLIYDKELPEKYQDHALKGEWNGFRECHIKPDLLLIYDKGE